MEKMLVTVFLAVLVLALAAGNAFLSLTSPTRLQRMALQRNKQLIETGLPSDPSQKQFGEAGQAFYSQPMEKNHSFELAAGRERTAHLNKRIDRLEQLLLKVNNSRFIAQKINLTNLGQKLNDFEEFKQNSRLEIAALRQRLDKIDQVKKREEGKAANLSDKKLRQLVFREQR